MGLKLLIGFVQPRSLFTLQGAKNHLREPLYRNAYALMLNTVLTSALGFLFWAIAARTNPPEHIGLASASVSATGLLASVANAGLGFGVIRYLPGMRGEGRSELVSSIFFLAGISAAACATIYLLGLKHWSPSLGFLLENPLFGAGFIGFVILATWTSLTDNVFVAQRSAQHALYKNVSGNSLKLFLPLLVAKLRWGAFGLYSCFGAAYVVSTLIGLYLLPRTGEEPVKLRLLRRPTMPGEVLRYSLAVYAAGFLQSAPTLILPIMVANLLGGEANAYFYICWAMVGLLLTVPGALSTSFFAEGSHEASAVREQALRCFAESVALLLPAIAGFALLGKPFLRAFGPAYARYGFPVLCVLSMASLPYAVIAPYITVLRINKRTKDLTAISALIFATSVGMCYAGITSFGLIGAAIGWLLAQATVAAIVALAVNAPDLLRRPG